jgi:Uma2 family endonuclease
MAAVATHERCITVEDLAARFGDLPAWRIRTDPPPGEATEEDALRLTKDGERTCELIDGVLVEKAMSAEASVLAAFFIEALGAFVRSHRLGWVLSSDGLIRLTTGGRLRAADVAFVRREQVPEGRFPRKPIPTLFPNVAIEVLSAGNTKREMEEKLDDDFSAGTELVWIVDPLSKTIRVFTSRETELTLSVGDTLDGGTVLPGFSVAVADVFNAVD